MYIELEKEYTKTRFSQILNETQQIAEKELSLNSEEESSDLWISIISQIRDIKKNIIENHVLLDWEEIYDRYSIGTIGLEYFDDDDEMHRRLCDIFHGVVHYQELDD